MPKTRGGELFEIAKLAFLFTGIIVAAAFIIMVIVGIFSSPPLRAFLLMFLSLWAIVFIIILLVYKLRNWRQTRKKS